MPHISGFYRLSATARIDALRPRVPADALDVVTSPGAPPDALDRMSENVIGQFELPLSVVPGVLVDGREHDVLMVTEEPSVVAAANKACSLFAGAGGTHTIVDAPVTRAQIMFAFEHNAALQDAAAALSFDRDRWIEAANRCDPALIAAGGGAFDLDIETRITASAAPSFLIASLGVRTADAMGANAVNTMAECLLRDMADFLRTSLPDTTFEPGIAIVTNAAPGRLVTASIELPFDLLGRFRPSDALAAPSDAGRALARRIRLASQFAEASPDRAVTHNKGILNGTTAVALPLGQDTRAIDTAALDFACRTGVHLPLARWKLTDGALSGTLRMPLVVGLVGGARNALPKISAAFRFDAISSYGDLCAVIASVALAQNFAALAALVTDGIQAGHIKLHQRKIAFP